MTDTQQVPTPSISVIATDLKIHTFQGVVIDGDSFVVPTFDHNLLRVQRDGSRSTLVQFCRGFECETFGAPFGIVRRDRTFLVTVTGYQNGGRILQVAPDGSYRTYADLSSITQAGGLFGITESQGNLFVAVSPDAFQSTGSLVKVGTNGDISTVADLSEHGMPFAVVEYQGQMVVAQAEGKLVQVTPQGQVSVLSDLTKQDLGIPLAVMVSQGDLIAAMNKGILVKVNPDGSATPLVNLLEARRGIPVGLADGGDRWIVTTTGGFLLKVQQAASL